MVTKKGSDGSPCGVPIKASSHIILEIASIVNTWTNRNHQILDLSSHITGSQSPPIIMLFRDDKILGSDGGIELVQDNFSRSLVRILDSSGLIWESDQRYKTVAEAVAAAELALADWVEDNLFAQRD